MPDILFRMPIKDNVTCKICKLLPNQWRLGPMPHSHLHSPALGRSLLPWRSHRSQAARPLGTVGQREAAGPKPPQSAEAGGDGEGPSSRSSSAPPLPPALGQLGCCCQARGRKCAGADPGSPLPGESPPWECVDASESRLFVFSSWEFTHWGRHPVP